jgi:long-chain acyl-CoA synthetase
MSDKPMINFFLEKMRSTPTHQALLSSQFSTTYEQLLELYDFFDQWLKKNNIPAGAVVSFDGDYSPSSISLLLALTKNKNIVVPLSRDSRNHFSEFREIAATEYDISLTKDKAAVTITGKKADHPIYLQLRESKNPGLVLFSSGSTGKSKAIVQDLNKLMSKFRTPRKSLRMLIFLQLDHIGGINSLLYSLANNGTIIVSDDRTPAGVCQAIQTFQADLLPTSPTFLNLLMLSKAYEEYDLSSLKLITYGTEPMQESTLKRLSAILPEAVLQQTYGLSEVGILRSKSRSSDSLWLKIGGEEFTTKIVNGTLWIKSDSAMLGYLNAPNPFDDDGFLDTGDLVEQDGEWVRILGRESEIINVGGYKVFPAEVESVLLEMDNVEDVVVFGEDHMITGKIVVAKFKLNKPESLRELKARMLMFCKHKLQKYKVPGKIILTDETTYNERFKRMRRVNRDLH